MKGKSMENNQVTQQYATFILSQIKDSLYDIVDEFGVDKEKEELTFKIKPTVIELFKNKFPNAKDENIYATIEWVILRAYVALKEKGEV